MRNRYPKHKSASNTPDVLVNIVIPVYGRFDLLRQALASIPEAFPDIPVDVTLVDNNSPIDPDGDSLPLIIETIQKYSSTSFDIYAMFNDKNLGFPKACNTGVNRGKAPLLFFLNSDVVLEPNSGAKLVAAFDHLQYGVAGMRLKFPDHTDLSQNENTRPAGKLQHICLSLDIQGRVYHPFLGWECDHPRIMKQKIVMAVTGAAMMVRRNLFRQVGGFGSEYGMGTFEDVDLCMKISNTLGYPVITVPEALGTHHTGATAEKYRIAYPMQENYRIFMDKWKTKLSYWDYYTL